ncbi:unnamed protein product, partial [Coregonus sp. 'balchen']
MYQLKVLVHRSNADVLVITETWLDKSDFLVRTFFGKTDLPKVVEWKSLQRNTFSARLSPLTPACTLPALSSLLAPYTESECVLL